MKRNFSVKLGVFTILLFLPVAAFARPVASRALPTWLTGSWVQEKTYSDQQLDKLAFTADGYYLHEITREMGEYGTYIPYPTPCRHLEGGRIEYFGAPSKATVERYARTRRQPPAFTMIVRLDRVELVP